MESQPKKSSDLKIDGKLLYKYYSLLNSIIMSR